MKGVKQRCANAKINHGMGTKVVKGLKEERLSYRPNIKIV